MVKAVMSKSQESCKVSPRVFESSQVLTWGYRNRRCYDYMFWGRSHEPIHMTFVGLQCRDAVGYVLSLVPAAGNPSLAFSAYNLTLLPLPDLMWWFCASPLPTPTPSTMPRPRGTQKSSTSAPEHLSSWWAARWTSVTLTWTLSIGPGDPG